MASLDDYPKFESPYAVNPKFAERPWADRMPTKKAAPLPALLPDNSILTDIGHGLAGGVSDLPGMAGQAVQAFAPEDSGIYKAAQRWRDAAKARESDPDFRTTGAWGEGARGVAAAGATMGVGALAALAAPAVGVTAGVGAAVGGGLAAAALFGGSTFKDVQEKALAAGATPEVAHEAGFKAGMVMGVGQAVASAVGGKVLIGAGGAIADKFLAKAATQNAIQDFVDPSAAKIFAKGTAEMFGTQVPVQAASAAALNAIEQDAGIDTKQTSWEAAKHSIGPTLAMTTLLAPFGIPGARRTAQQKEAIAGIVSGDTPATKEARIANLNEMTKEMRKVTDREAALDWQTEAMKAIEADEPVGMLAGFNAEQAREQRAAEQQQANERAKPPLALPAPGDVAMPMGEGGNEFNPERQAAVDNAQRVYDARDNEELRQAAAGVKVEPVEEISYTKAQEKLERGTKADETKAIREKFKLPPNTPGTSVIDKLRGLDHEQQLDELQKIFDPAKDAKYMQAIGDTLKKAGRIDEEGKPNENAQRRIASEAPAEVGKGAEPQPAAVQAKPEDAARAVEVAQAQGNADAGRAAGAAPQGAGQVTAKEAAEKFAGQADTLSATSLLPAGESHVPAQVKDSSASRKENAPVVEQRRTEAQVKAERQSPEKEVDRAVAALDKFDKATQALVDRATTLRSEPQTRENYAKLKELETEIGQRKHGEERSELVLDHSDAVGRAEKVHNPEPGYTAGAFSFVHPGAVERNSHADTLSFVAAKKSAGVKLSPEQEKLLAGRGPEKKGARGREEAVEALKESDKSGATKIFEARAEQLIRVKDTAAKMMDLAKENEPKVNRSVRGEAADQLEMQEGLAINDRNFAKGLISEQQHLANIAEMKAAAADKQSIRNRGLAGLGDASLALKVAENPRAQAVMEHIAEMHHNPLVRAIAKVLAKARPNALISLVDNPDFNGGRYRPMSHTIEIGRGGMNPVTLMHETVHSLTHAAIDRVFENVHKPFESLSKQEQAEIGAYKTLNTLRDNFAKVANMDDPAHRLSLENNHEFVSEAISNSTIHEAMGGASKLRQFWNALREMVGLDAKHQTDFEKLMQVSATLFGSPNRHSLEAFNRAIEETGRDAAGNAKATPQGKITGLNDTMGQLDKLRSTMHAKWDTKHNIEKVMLGWTTYNNGIQWMRRQVDALKLAHPQHSDKLEAMYNAVSFPRSVIERRNAGNATLVRETSPMLRDMDRLQRDKPEQMGRMYELARRLVQDPENAKNKADLARMKADPKLKDVSDMYDRMLLKNKLDLARKGAATLDLINDMHGFGKSEDLNWVTHTQTADKNGDMRTEQSWKVQLDRNNAAIDRARAESAARLTAAGFDPASEHGKTATNHSEAINNYLKGYDAQRAKPYVHMGRSGENMIHFDVQPARWEEVRKIVTGTTAEGGLDRDMGPIVKGNNTVDMRFDNTMQHAAAEARLKALLDSGAFKNDKGESTWASGPISERYKKTDGATPLFIRKLSARIDGLDMSVEAKDDMKRQIHDAYLQQLPDTNPLKASMSADQTGGSSRDMFNTFRDRQMMANSSLTGGQYAHRMGEAMSDIDVAMKNLRESGVPGEVSIEMGRYVDAIRQRANDAQIPVHTPVIDAVRAVAAPFRLMLSAAYLTMTAYQPFQMTLPAIGGRYGFTNSGRAMGRNYSVAFAMLNHVFADAWDASKGESTWRRLDATASPTIDFSLLKNKDGTPLLTGAQLELANHLQMVGLINFGQTQQLFRMDESAKGAIAQGSRVASIFPHYVEMANRIVSAFTAHEMALTKGAAKSAGEAVKMMDKATPEQKKYAREYAMSTIRDTDGDHSQANLASKLSRRGFANGATPLLVGFNQYDFQMTESLVRMAIKAVGKGEEGSIARKQLAGVAVATSLMAGTLGMPFMGLLTGLYNRIVQALQGDEDTPPDFEKSWADHLKGIFGEKGGEIAARGLPRLFDIDMSTRSGYQDLAPFTSFLTDRQKLSDAIASHALDFLGPGVGVGVGLLKGADDLRRGNVPAAINDALPAVARNFAKAYRMQQYGYERMSDGNAPIQIPVSGWNVLAQAGGFGSGAKAEEGEQQSQWDINQKIMADRNQNNRNKWLVAQEHNDPQRMGEAMEAIIKTATEQPQYMHTPSALTGALKQRQQNAAISAQLGGVHVGKGQIPFYQQFHDQGGPPPFP